ncbi:hypothetical protein BDW71DRAFT_180466 [Aspergillus fruticulosus]
MSNRRRALPSRAHLSHSRLTTASQPVQTLPHGLDRAHHLGSQLLFHPTVLCAIHFFPTIVLTTSGTYGILRILVRLFFPMSI